MFFTECLQYYCTSSELTETPDIEKAWNELQAQKNSACNQMSQADYWGCLKEVCLCEAPEYVCLGSSPVTMYSGRCDEYSGHYEPTAEQEAVFISVCPDATQGFMSSNDWNNNVDSAQKCSVYTAAYECYASDQAAA